MMKHVLKTGLAVLSMLAITACGGAGSTSSSTSSSSSSTSSSSSSTSSSSSSSASSTSSGGDANVLVLAVNAGGAAVVSNDVAYRSDAFYSGGDINETEDRVVGGAIFESERYGAFVYQIPVTDGRYEVTLHMAEIYHEGVGARSVNVQIEDQWVIEDWDLAEQAGHDVGYSYTPSPFTVSDGYISIRVEGGIGDGTMSGFAIYSADGQLDIDTQQNNNENRSADCAIPPLLAPDQLPSITNLPNPFVAMNGDPISDTEDWLCRREEIRQQAQKYIYGEKPTAPEVVTGSVTSSAISVQVADQGQSIEFSAQVVLPERGQPPFPAMINVGAKSGFGGITLGESRILDQGVAIIYYNHYDIGAEGTPEASRGNPNPGKFYDLYGGYHSAGLLTAWAWGASRILDVLAQPGNNIIDPTAVGVTGCSRNGKGAFAVGLFDDRIALTIPHETSTAGVPAYRIVDQLDTERTDHNFYGLNWLSNDFEPFVLNTSQLPIDTHSLIGVIAPRGLLILDNPHERQMSAPAGHMAALAGAQIYEFLGHRDNISYHSNVPNTGHCSYKSEYTDLLIENIRKFLKKEGGLTGTFNVGANGSLNEEQWIDWQAPISD